MCESTMHHELDAYDSVHVSSTRLHQHPMQHGHYQHHHKLGMGTVDLDYEVRLINSV